MAKKICLHVKLPLHCHVGCSQSNPDRLQVFPLGFSTASSEHCMHDICCQTWRRRVSRAQGKTQSPNTCFKRRLQRWIRCINRDSVQVGSAASAQPTKKVMWITKKLCEPCPKRLWYACAGTTAGFQHLCNQLLAHSCQSTSLCAEQMGARCEACERLK